MERRRRPDEEIKEPIGPDTLSLISLKPYRLDFTIPVPETAKNIGFQPTT